MSVELDRFVINFFMPHIINYILFLNLNWYCLYILRQTDIRTMVVKQWGSDMGIELLKDLSQLYLNLVWESTVLLSLCSGEYQPGTIEFGKQDLEKLTPAEGHVSGEQKYK